MANQEASDYILADGKNIMNHQLNRNNQNNQNIYQDQFSYQNNYVPVENQKNQEIQQNNYYQPPQYNVPIQNISENNPQNTFYNNNGIPITKIPPANTQSQDSIFSCFKYLYSIIFVLLFFIFDILIIIGSIILGVAGKSCGSNCREESCRTKYYSSQEKFDCICYDNISYCADKILNGTGIAGIVLIAIGCLGNLILLIKRCRKT